jgi:serine protease Do
VNAERRLAAALLLATALPFVGGPARAAQTLESTRRTNGAAVQASFEPVRAVLQDSSAVIRRGSKEIVYGTVMSADGFILTKASELGEVGGLSVTVGAKTYEDPVLLASDPAWDVALLKVAATGLVPVRLVLDGPDPARGTWVVANGATSLSRRRPQVGIISASAREIAPAGGAVLGVTLEEKPDRLRVTEVHEGSGAEAAGIRSGDRIVAAGGAKVADRAALGEVIGKLRVGDELELTVERAGKKLELKVRMAGRADLFGEEKSRNDEMSGRFSERRSGFPRVIQHDIIANAAGMGGPLLDLDGRCLGMNIARANRSETFAIPAGDLRSLADRLMTRSGK